MDFSKLNSATKYPSIYTHHKLGQRGMLTDELGPFAEVNPQEIVYLREKIDGTNTRVIVMPDGDYFIGSREELLHAKGDRIWNPALGIVDAVVGVAEEIVRYDGGRPLGMTDYATVFYLETYGGKITAQSKQYTGAGKVGFRMFDYAVIPLSTQEWDKVRIARWRDEEGGQQFGDLDDLKVTANAYGIPVVPNLGAMRMEELPTDLGGMLDLLQRNLPETLVSLDEDGKGEPEGIVLRTHDRSVISKARFQDYRRTLRQRG